MMRYRLAFALLGLLGFGLAINPISGLTASTTQPGFGHKQKAEPSPASKPTRTQPQLTPQTQALSKEEKATIADQMFQEGMELFQKQTPESLKTAIEKLELAQKLFKNICDKRKEAMTLFLMGYSFQILNQKQQSVQLFHQALYLYREIKDQKEEAITLNNIGAVYYELGENPKALEYFNQVLALYQRLSDSKSKATILNNLGKVNNDLGEFEQALFFFNQALPLYQQNKDWCGEAATLTCIGNVYRVLSR